MSFDANTLNYDVNNILFHGDFRVYFCKIIMQCIDDYISQEPNFFNTLFIDNCFGNINVDIGYSFNNGFVILETERMFLKFDITKAETQEFNSLERDYRNGTSRHETELYHAVSGIIYSFLLDAVDEIEEYAL